MRTYFHDYTQILITCQGLVGVCESTHLFLKGDDPGLNLFQGEVVNGFSCGVRQVGQVCAEVSEQLSRDDEADVFIDHCKRTIEQLVYMQVNFNVTKYQSENADTTTYLLQQRPSRIPVGLHL